MPVSQRAVTRREALNIRIKPKVRELIDRAAELAGKNRTDFVLDAARRAAEDTLLDRTVLTVSWRIDSSWRAWMLRHGRTSGCSRACGHALPGSERANLGARTAG
jgi:uncharacterized protein (DUF1778 family)